jgi:hypothetical protein
MQSLVFLLRDPHYGYFPEVGDALVERARGISATHFLRHTDADVYLGLDSDIIDFQKPAMDLMCEQAMEHDIVGAVYICRSTARTFPATFFKEGERVLFENDPTPVPVKWIAAGCVAIHRRVFEKLAETLPLLHEKDGMRAFYPFYQSMIWDEGGDIGKILLSEDFAFSQRATDVGFTPHINPAIRIGHIGPYAHRLEDMLADYLEPQPLALTRVDRYWRVEGEGRKATPEDMGRLPPGKGEHIRQKFEELKPSRAERRRNERKDKKALTRA